MAIKYDPILDALREADTSGSSDTASNLGTGVGVYSYKNSGVFYFNSLADSSTIGVSAASGGNIIFNLLSIPSSLIPDPLNINNLNVYSTASINLAHISNIDFNLTSGATTVTEGQMNWNNTHGYIQYGLPGGNVELAVGMEQVLPRRCKNSSGTTMTKGTVVYISGVSGNDPIISRALATSDATSAFTIGVCAEDIPDGQKGWICTFGVISGLNLSSYTAGDTVYLSGTNAGEFTKTKPYAPIHYVRIGIVTKATSDGDLVVNVINGFEMDELHNVSAHSAVSGDILRYNGTTSLWETQSLIQPQSKALITGQYLDSYDATTGLFTSSVFNSANATHNNLSGLQGGTAGEYNHLTNAQVTNLNNQSGTNTGDETKTSIETKLGAASSSNSGYLTSTDWSTFNGKLTPNAPITGATKTKITYDSNGLVTAGADATTADISDTTNKRYVTDADLTTLSNTSGTNTGDVTVTDSSTIDFTLTGQALTGSVIEGGITHNNLGSLQGGTAGEYYHLTNAQLTNLNNQSGTNTGDITVTDTATIDFTLTGQALTASVIEGGITHNNLAGLTTGDPHTQYALLAGRSGGQTLYGGTASGDDLYLQSTSNATKGFVLLNSAGGNVGIGNTNPAYSLDVSNSNKNGKIASNNFIIKPVDVGTLNYVMYGNGNALEFTTENGSAGALTFYKIEQFGVLASDLSNILSVDTTNGFTCDYGGYFGGNLLIGSTGYLSIRDGVVDAINTLAAGDILTGTSAAIFQLDISSSQAIFQQSATNPNGNFITFRKSRGTTSSPTVASTGDSSGVIRAYTYDGTAYDEITRIEMESVSAQNSGAIRFWTMNAGTIGEKMSIINNGNVGIGVAAPTYKIQVNGQPAANGYTAWTNYSDQRLKENIESISTGVLNKICNLRPVTFNYNTLTGYDEETRARKITGFIAQEVMQEFPEMVGTNVINGTEYYDTNLSNLQIYLVQAVKEQQVIIEELRNEVNNLKGLING